jgi:hypothetical protein
MYSSYLHLYNVHCKLGDQIFNYVLTYLTLIGQLTSDWKDVQCNEAQGIGIQTTFLCFECVTLPFFPLACLLMLPCRQWQWVSCTMMAVIQLCRQKHIFRNGKKTFMSCIYKEWSHIHELFMIIFSANI